MPSVRIVCISDTHGQHRHIPVPAGDILIHAGDLTRSGAAGELGELSAWLAELPHRHKVLIAGNHDGCFEQRPALARSLLRGATYLQDEPLELMGLRLYGSPWTPEFFDWSFMLPRGAPLAAMWAKIPAGTDVLITHGPPLGHGDRTVRGANAGCADLLAAVQRLRPRYHIFGHIHEAAGVSRAGPTTFINASSVDLRYRPVHAPVVIDVEAAG